MAQKVIRLTESDLTRLVKKVIEEQQSPAIIHTNGVIGAPMSLKTAIAKDYKNAKTRTFQVFEVKGKPTIKKNGQNQLLTPGMKITPEDFLNFKGGDEVTMKSISPEDKGKYFQYVTLYINPQNKLELFVTSN